MTTLFLRILDLNLMAGWLILAVLLLRLLLKKAPKWEICALWALVAIRLLIPFTVESPFSLLPRTNIDLMKTTNSSAEEPSKPSFVVVNIIEPSASSSEDTATIVSMSSNQEKASASSSLCKLTNFFSAKLYLPAVSWIWLIGMSLMLFQALCRYILLRKKVSAYLEFDARDFQTSLSIRKCDEVKAPFLLGLLRPIVYIPTMLDPNTLHYVLLHESAHVSRRDHWWKPLGYLLLSVYWMNPLCWIAYIFFCRDIESACDEKVIRQLDHDGLAAYSEALLSCVTPKMNIGACPLAFGETNAKKRIKNILNYKKPVFWLVLGPLVVMVLLAVCFLTNPQKPLSQESETSSMKPSDSSEEQIAIASSSTDDNNTMESTPNVNTDTTDNVSANDISPVETIIDSAYMKGSTFFIPINGKIALYEIFPYPAETPTKLELLSSFLEDPLGLASYQYQYDIYSLKEYPLYELLLVTITDTKDGATSDLYIGSKSLVKTSDPSELEKAITDGLYVLKNGRYYANEEVMTRFYQNAEQGNPASMLIAMYYELGNVSAELYEAEKDNYPQMYYNLLKYDGKEFMLSPVHVVDDQYVVYEIPGFDSPTSTWKYLMHYEGTPTPGSVPANIIGYNRYVLTNDNTVTWEAIETDRLDGITEISSKEISVEYFETK